MRDGRVNARAWALPVRRLRLIGVLRAGLVERVPTLSWFPNHEEGAASNPGLQLATIILKLDEHALAGVDDLHRLLTAERANRESHLTVLRGPSIERVTIILEADD